MDEEDEIKEGVDTVGAAEDNSPPEEEKKSSEEEKKSPEEEKKSPPKTKGNWKNIGHEPVNYELHPCVHKWKAKHPRGPCIQYKQIRWVLVPLSDRLKQLAMPLLRRLLALWLEFGDKMSPEMRARLMGFICENYGLSADFLEQILEEAVKAKAKEASKEKKQKSKKKKGKKKRKKKSKKGGKKGEKKEKKEGKKKKDKKDSGLLFKKRKPGKLPLDWPYKMGTKFLLTCISYLSKDPDEDYNSRASEYFDVQSRAILELFCFNLEMAIPDPERPTQFGEAMVIMALNLSNWIAKFITSLAQKIPDDKVEEYLELRGVKPKPIVVKAKKEKPDKDVKGKKGKEEKKQVEVVTEIQRNWEEHKAPVYIPEKSRISKRKPLEEEEEEVVQESVIQEEVRPASDKGSEKGKKKKKDDKKKVKVEVVEEKMKEIPEPREPNLDDVKKDFLEYINWYNPWEPEFMFFGPRRTPDGISMWRIFDPESNEIPADLRVLNWNQIEYGFKDNYSFIPASVPQYYPSLRPLRPLRSEDLEKAGVPREVMKQNLRFFSPWYLMNKPLRPLPPPPLVLPVSHLSSHADDGFHEEHQGEFELEIDHPEKEEVIHDELLESESKKPPIKDSFWGDYVMKEQFEMLAHLLHLMTSVPDLTLEHVFELLEEFCEAVACAESDENSTPENKLLQQKRTIILEQYFLDFFGKKFRDYNTRTPFYMRVLCARCAYYIQLLYEYTARILWKIQSQPNPPTPIPSRPETPDDPDALRDWDEWLAWLLKVTKTCDEWAGWISETVNEAEKKATKKKNEFVGPDGRIIPLSTEEWYGWKSQVERKVIEYRSSKKEICKESPYYLEKAKHILPVKHRQKICKWVSETYGEEEEEEEEKEEEEEEENSWIKKEKVYDDDETDGDTEWEDVGEVDE